MIINYINYGRKWLLCSGCVLLRWASAAGQGEFKCRSTNCHWPNNNNNNIAAARSFSIGPRFVLSLALGRGLGPLSTRVPRVGFRWRAEKPLSNSADTKEYNNNINNNNKKKEKGNHGVNINKINFHSRKVGTGLTIISIRVPLLFFREIRWRAK